MNSGQVELFINSVSILIRLRNIHFTSLLFTSLLIRSFLPSLSAQTGDFPFQNDVGDPAIKGFSVYDQVSQSYQLKGSGYNIWFERDEFHYLYDSLQGNFILTAQFEFIGEGFDPHRKIGWMVRESSDAQSAHVSATLHGDGLTVLQWRALRGAYMQDPRDQIFSPKSNYSILQLERNGKEFILRAAHPGEPLQLIGSKLMDMPDKVLAGLFICSHNASVSEEAKVWNVRMDFPMPDGYNAYRDGLKGARLETMDVFSGHRKVIHKSDIGFEAPNWMADGRLLFNQQGLIYSIPCSGGKISQLQTGDIRRNNNDHVVSWSGKQLGISSSSEGYNSRIYVLPIEGGNPRLITPLAPSYLHSWSPDDSEVIYTAQRDGKPYNLYKSRISDGKETQLTFNSGLTDGPEYSPDGKFIYFNGTQSGTMQLWRMKPDGTDKTQLTYDEYNNWFAHISPDNQWIAYIAFPKDIPVNDHPHYKRVELKLMPVNGGAPRTIAYLYGGQGSINVPSWSPDSRKIAFVSYYGLRN